MRLAVVASCLLGAALTIAACSDTSTQPRAEPTPSTAALEDAAAWTTPDEVDDSQCPKHASYTDCHVCCLVAHPALIDLVWETFRVCACRLPKPLPCADECGEAYCGESFPMSTAPRACRRCLGDSADERLLSCFETAALACDADRDCSPGLACDMKCPELLPGEDEDAAEEKAFEILDGGAR
jgi:hypothetical protein